MNLIIYSSLIDTPLSQNLAIRYVTAFSRCDLELYNLIEVESELKDAYYYYMKPLGLMDYIEQYITPEENVNGIRLDTEFNYTNTIKTKSINFENTLNLIEQIKLFANRQ